MQCIDLKTYFFLGFIDKVNIFLSSYVMYEKSSKIPNDDIVMYDCPNVDLSPCCHLSLPTGGGGGGGGGLVVVQ